MRNHGPRTGLSRAIIERGFTLTDTLIAAAIMFALLGIAIPGFSELGARSRAVGSMLELRALLELARQSAIAERTEITVCGAAPPTACSKLWSGTPALAFADANTNRRADPGERVLAVSELTRAGRIRWQGSGGRNYLRYRVNGSVREFGTFVYCPASNDRRHARALIVSATGRVRSAVDADKDGIVEDSSGNAVSCAW